MTLRRLGLLAGLVLAAGPITAGAAQPATGATGGGRPGALPGVTSAPRDSFSRSKRTSPDNSDWKVDTSGQVFNRQSLETYTASPDNVALDGQGHLRITVRRTTSNGKDTYTSGRLISRDLVGPDVHIAARIKMAGGYGLWPLF